MRKEDLAKSIKSEFGKKTESFSSPSKKRIYLEIRPDYLRTAVKYLKEQGLRFSTASAIDERDYMEVLYHFSYDKEGVFVSLRIKLERKKPGADTIADIITGAKWIEREMRELMGIRFEGNEDMREFLLSKDYKGRKYPLRKDG